MKRGRETEKEEEKGIKREREKEEERGRRRKREREGGRERAREEERGRGRRGKGGTWSDGKEKDEDVDTQQLQYIYSIFGRVLSYIY